MDRLLSSIRGEPRICHFVPTILGYFKRDDFLKEDGESCLDIVHNDIIKVFDPQGVLVGSAYLEFEQRGIIVYISIDYNTPIRLDIQNGAKVGILPMTTPVKVLGGEAVKIESFQLVPEGGTGWVTLRDDWGEMFDEEE